MDYPQAEIGVFGGSGLYSLLEDPAEITVQTPYGDPSGRSRMARLVDVPSLSCRGMARHIPSRRT